MGTMEKAVIDLGQTSVQSVWEGIEMCSVIGSGKGNLELGERRHKTF